MKQKMVSGDIGSCRSPWGNIRDSTPILDNQMENDMETGIIMGNKTLRPTDEKYSRGLNNYRYHFGVHLRYHMLQIYKEYGTIAWVII